jgi:hypothetical protein
MSLCFVFVLVFIIPSGCCDLGNGGGAHTRSDGCGGGGVGGGSRLLLCR